MSIQIDKDDNCHTLNLIDKEEEKRIFLSGQFSEQTLQTRIFLI